MAPASTESVHPVACDPTVRRPDGAALAHGRRTNLRGSPPGLTRGRERWRSGARPSASSNANGGASASRCRPLTSASSSSTPSPARCRGTPGSSRMHGLPRPASSPGRLRSTGPDCCTPRMRTGTIDDSMASVEQQRPLQTQYRIIRGDGEVRSHPLERADVRARGRPSGDGGCQHRCDGRRAATAGTGRRARAGGSRQPGQERVPRQDEPRNPHADERRHRHDRMLLRHRAQRATQREYLDDGPQSARLRCSASSTTSSTSPRSKPASSTRKSIPAAAGDGLGDTLALLSGRPARTCSSTLSSCRDPPEHLAATRAAAPGGHQPGRQRDQVHAQGQVTVRASMDRRQRRSTLPLRVEITDTGVGITPEAQQRSSGVRAGRFLDSRRFGGTGWGLPSAASWWNSWGGASASQACRGMGSTFWFVVPALATPAAVERR